MANLTETPVWETGVYQWENTDPIEGGANGIDNVPTRQLANRTSFLRQVLAVPYAVGDLLYATGANLLAKLPIGAANRVLTSSGTAPQWSDSLTLGGVIAGGELKGRRYTSPIVGFSSARYLVGTSPPNYPDPAGAPGPLFRVTVGHNSSGSIRIRLLLSDSNGHSAFAAEGVFLWGKCAQDRAVNTDATITTTGGAGTTYTTTPMRPTFSLAQLSIVAAQTVYMIRVDGIDNTSSNTMYVVGELDVLEWVSGTGTRVVIEPQNNLGLLNG